MPQIVSRAEQQTIRRPAPASNAASPAQIAPAFPEKGHLAIPFSDALAQRAVQRQCKRRNPALCTGVAYLPAHHPR